MTLILSFADRKGIIQVVDRLATVRRGSRATAFDGQFNKTLVYAARDGVAVISFTGVAYIGNTPTDQWVAQQLWREPIAEFSEREPWTYQGRQPVGTWPSLGEALKDLQKKTTQALQKQTPKASLTFAILGWQFYRSKRARPFTTTVAWQAKQEICTVDSIPRHIGKFAHLTVEPKGYLSEAEEYAILEAMDRKGWDDMEAEMVSAVRMVARRSPFVGPDCICVTLPHPSVKRGRIRYDSQTKLQMRLFPSLLIPVAFIPWIIHERYLRAPSIISGPAGLVCPFGRYSLFLTGTGEKTDPRQPATFQTGQPRRKRPT